MKKYILKDKDVGFLASSVALQEGKIFFEKDSETSFYIATVEGDDIQIPESLRALEMQITEETMESQHSDDLDKTLNELVQNPDANSTDLVLRLHLNQNIDPAKFPVLYEEIAKAVNSAIKKMDD